jgi:hypothetical protein
MKKQIAAVIFSVMAVSMLTACNAVTSETTPGPSMTTPEITSPATTPVTQPVPPGTVGLTSMITSPSINGLALSLSINSTSFVPGQGIAVTIDERNTLAETNNVSAAKDWPLEGLSVGPCGTINYPFGVAVFKGYYTADNISGAVPLKLYDPDAVYHCPLILSEITSYDFQPSSNTADIYGSCEPNPCMTGVRMNSEVEVKGYWDGSPKAQYSDLTPGVYTVAGGDEWGAVVLLYFSVHLPVGTEAPYFPPTLVREVPEPAPAPWPDVATYTEDTYEIEVNAGDEFAIGMFATTNINFSELHDRNIIELVDSRTVEYSPGALNKYGTDWFLYKAVKAGKTEIVFQYPIEYTKIFSISVK